MLRAVWAVAFAVVAWTSSPAQDPVLHITVSVLDADGHRIPVPRHALLISDNPSTAPPRRVVTSPEGTAQLPLRPGNYTVESDRPFVLAGQTYEWLRTLDMTAGRDATLELTMANATVGAATADVLRDAEKTASAPALRADAILSAWQASTFGLWTPLAHGGGFLADAMGLVATSARAIGDTRAIEVQISQTLKVAGVVLLADATRDVAILRVHPSAIEGIRSVPLACDAPMNSVGGADSERYMIDVPMFGAREVSESFVSAGGAGGPVFAGDGQVIGLSSPAGPPDARQRADVRVVARDAVCQVLASARGRLNEGALPDATRLPIEPPRRSAAPSAGASPAAGAFTLGPYQLSSQDFDITFLTPPVLAAARAKRDWTGGRAEELNGRRVATEFEQWDDYVADAPPLLYVRVTPRLVEGFWMKVARGAASTQGAQIPPIKRLRPGFSRMRLLCGKRDVTPVHPFRIQARVTETEAIDEGFYVFDPGAIGPDCGVVSIVLSSVKDPDRTETRVVDPVIVRRISEDFVAARSGARN